MIDRRTPAVTTQAYAEPDLPEVPGHRSAARYP